jgi:hypothetical protein
MSGVEPGGDPFLDPRDPGEATADAAMREFLLCAAPPDKVYRQDGGGYALIVPRLSGARLLTVPGANEADFMFHGNAGTGGERLADFIAATAAESGADHVRLPLLSETQAAWLRARLAECAPDWLWSISLSAIIPLAGPQLRQPRMERAIARAERVGVAFEWANTLDSVELEDLHGRRWGRGNRSGSFFRMLSVLFEAGCAEFMTARSRDGALIAAQFDIVGTTTRHFYHVASDTTRAPGCGTAVLGMSWRRFKASDSQTIYSFGRGAERYKYQYANRHRTVFDLRGFYAPV